MNKKVCNDVRKNQWHLLKHVTSIVLQWWFDFQISFQRTTYCDLFVAIQTGEFSLKSKSINNVVELTSMLKLSGIKLASGTYKLSTMKLHGQLNASHYSLPDAHFWCKNQSTETRGETFSLRDKISRAAQHRDLSERLMCFQIIAEILNFGHRGSTSLVKSAISLVLIQKKNKPSFALELVPFARWRSAWWIGARREESAQRKHFNSPGRQWKSVRWPLEAFLRDQEIERERYVPHGCYNNNKPYNEKQKRPCALFSHAALIIYGESLMKKAISEWEVAYLFAFAPERNAIIISICCSSPRWWSCKSHALTDWNVADVTANSNSKTSVKSWPSARMHSKGHTSI